MFYSTGVAGDQGVRDGAVKEGIEYVRGVQCRIRSCFDFEVILRILQSTCSYENLYNFLSTGTLHKKPNTEWHDTRSYLVVHGRIALGEVVAKCRVIQAIVPSESVTKSMRTCEAVAYSRSKLSRVQQSDMLVRPGNGDDPFDRKSPFSIAGESASHLGTDTDGNCSLL